MQRWTPDTNPQGHPVSPELPLCVGVGAAERLEPPRPLRRASGSLVAAQVLSPGWAV